MTTVRNGASLAANFPWHVLICQPAAQPQFSLLPRSVGHTFGNQSGSPSRLLVLHSPAMDAYFEELLRLWSGDQPPDREEERELMSRFGMEPAAQ